MRTDDGAFVVGEPLGSPGWFPSNNHPKDKALFDISVEVPRPYKAVSNGTLDVENDGNMRTFNWTAEEPMATYLATATVGKFKTEQDDDPPGSTDFSYVAVDPRFPGDGSIDKGFEMIDFFEDVFGPYPFAATGGIVDAVQRRLRARDADSPDLPRAPGLGPRLPRAGPPVVRQRRLAGGLVADLAERGLRDLRELALVGVPRPADPSREARLRLPGAARRPRTGARPPAACPGPR